MKIRIVGSSSRGNGYILETNNGSQLLIEAGRPIKEFRSCGLKTAKAVGLLVSHSHGDHCKYINDFIKVNIDIYSTSEVKELYQNSIEVNPSETTHVDGGFSFTPFVVKHDVPCFGYLVHHKEMGSLFFATDCFNLTTIIKGINVMLIEDNYQDEILNKVVQNGDTNSIQAARIRLSHLSHRHCKAFLWECQVEKSARAIVLIHGSNRHNNMKMCKDDIQQTFGIPTYIASSKLEINI